VRCAFDASAPTIWQAPGSLNRFFANIVQTAPNVTVHSGPADIVQRLNNLGTIPDGPWILTIDDFLSPAECEHLIQQGEALGFKRATGVQLSEDASEAKYVESEGRTSSNAWCEGSCASHPETQTIAQRIHQLTAPITELHSEHWHLLKYTTGQFCGLHSDYIEDHFERILTVFFYLNTPTEGGGTNFPALAQDLTVQPVRGRAVLWPSVLDQEPNTRDERTVHQALPAGTTKYAMNVWLHRRDISAFLN
jgi:prolyl 4-hydroxylase